MDLPKHCASMRNPSSSGLPCPVRAASRSVRSAGWGSAAMESAHSRALQTCSAGNHLVDQADALGFVGVDHPSGDDQLDGAPVSEDPGDDVGFDAAFPRPGGSRAGPGRAWIRLVEDVRAAPDRSGREFVFLARRP